MGFTPGNCNVQMSHVQRDWGAGLSKQCREGNQESELNQLRAIIQLGDKLLGKPRAAWYGYNFSMCPRSPILSHVPSGEKVPQMAPQQHRGEYTCVCVCVCMSVYVHTWVSVNSCVCVCVSMCLCVCMWVCLCLYVSVNGGGEMTGVSLTL